MKNARTLESLSDKMLLQRLTEFVRTSRRVESDVVAHIGEVDRRRLYLSHACSSMFVYCTEVLHFSESEAYLRIAVARAARRYPMLLTMLREGQLHLTAIGKLAPHLTEENHEKVLARAGHKSKRNIEELVAELSPRPDVPATIRKLPERKENPDGVPAATPQLRPDAVGQSRSARSARSAHPTPPAAYSASASKVEPLAPTRYRVQFTASAELQEKIERLRELMRTSIPNGDLAEILEAAVTEKIERLEAKRYGQVATPRKTLESTDTSPTSRSVPVAVIRAVFERDGHRCTFVDERGKRCAERNWLEFHHEVPYGVGGDHGPDNIRLLCKAHNMYLAEQDYGEDLMAHHRRDASFARESRPPYGTSLRHLPLMRCGASFTHA